MSESTPRTILLVEDELATRTLISRYISDAGFVVLEAANAADFRRILRSRKPIDLVLLDLRLPDADGMDLARELRQTSQAGLIFVTSVNDEIDRVLGLELGADDYVTKPIAMRELLARIRSTLRRVAPAGEAPRSPTMRMLGPWEIDLFRREARDNGGGVVQLTRAEFDLLAVLVEADGRSVARDLLLDVVSNRSEEVSDRTVDTLISRLRSKLESDPKQPTLLLTDRGVGYRAALTRR